MVKLTKIRIRGNIAMCHYHPEKSEEYGILKVDLDSGNIVYKEYPPKECPSMYITVARSKLVEICRSGEELPEEATCVWF